LIGAVPFSSSGRRIFGCCNGGVFHQEEHAMKMLADFSLAAAAALAIGIAVGTTAFSLVWLIARLNA
jgi:hypothetical protein